MPSHPALLLLLLDASHGAPFSSNGQTAVESFGFSEIFLGIFILFVLVFSLWQFSVEGGNAFARLLSRLFTRAEK